MLEADLNQVLAIERDSFPTPWAREAFLGQIRSPEAWAFALIDGRRRDRAVIGYVCFWQDQNRLHLLNLCLARPYRRQGLAQGLLGFVTGLARQRGLSGIDLEVRQGNLAALRLYRSAGFIEAGVRPGYYSDTGQDALLMTLGLESSQKAVDSDSSER